MVAVRSSAGASRRRTSHRPRCKRSLKLAARLSLFGTGGQRGSSAIFLRSHQCPAGFADHGRQACGDAQIFESPASTHLPFPHPPCVFGRLTGVDFGPTSGDRGFDPELQFRSPTQATRALLRRSSGRPDPRSSFDERGACPHSREWVTAPVHLRPRRAHGKVRLDTQLTLCQTAI